MEEDLVGRQGAVSGRSAAGFSVIEGLIAGTILLVIALGLVPLFTRSILNNSIGSDATQASNHSKTRLEEFLPLPFNHARLTVPGGSDESESLDTWTSGRLGEIGDADEGWWPGAPVDKGPTSWTRTTRVRQYNISDLDDGTLDNPELGGTQPIFIHLKEVEVQMDSARQGIFLGGGRGLTVRVLKPF